MLIEEPESMAHKPIPMIISATSEGGQGTVGMVVKVNKGAIRRRARRNVLLNQIARQGGRTGGQGHSAGLGGDHCRRPLGFQLRNQNKDNPAAVEPRYGQDLRHHRSHPPPCCAVAAPNTSFDLPSDGSIDFERVAISCSFAANQAAYALALRPREKVTLTGVVDSYDQIGRVLWLKDCRGNRPPGKGPVRRRPGLSFPSGSRLAHARG